MAWIESHQELRAHPKTLRLARTLGISVPQAIGHLHLLWWWCLDYAQDGDLTGQTAADIAEAALWDGDADLLVEALLGCGTTGSGFLDRGDGGSLEVHDWWEYVGRLIEQRAANAEKQRRWRAARQAARNGHVTVTETVTRPSRNPATGPNRTGPNRTGPGSLAVADAPAEGSESAPMPALEERAPRKPQPFQEQLDALCEVLEIRDLDSLTTVERGRLISACKQLHAAKRSRAEIVQAAANWYPGRTMTAAGLAANITDLLRGPPRPSSNGSARQARETAAGEEAGLARLEARYRR